MEGKFEFQFGTEVEYELNLGLNLVWFEFKGFILHEKDLWSSHYKPVQIFRWQKKDRRFKKSYVKCMSNSKLININISVILTKILSKVDDI